MLLQCVDIDGFFDVFQVHVFTFYGDVFVRVLALINPEEICPLMLTGFSFRALSAGISYI